MLCSFRLTSVSLWHAPILCFWTLSYFLVLQCAPDSSCIFLVLDQQSNISLKNALFFFLGEQCLEAKIWALSVWCYYDLDLLCIFYVSSKHSLSYSFLITWTTVVTVLMFLSIHSPYLGQFQSKDFEILEMIFGYFF